MHSKRKENKTDLRESFGNLEKNDSSVSRFALRKREEELRDEGDPVPRRHVAFVAVERFRNRSGRVVQAEEPEDPYEQLPHLGTLVESSRLQITADGVRGDAEVVRILLEHSIVILSPLRPRFRESHVHRNGHVERLIRFVVKSELREEHSLERKEFGFLSGVEVHEIRVVDDLESTRELGGILVVTFRLFSKLEERFLDFNVRESVDFGEGGDADFVEVVLSSDVGEAIDDPGGFVVSSVGERIRILARSGILRRGDEREVRLVDCGEYVLSPSYEVAPDVDVVPQIWQSIPPSAEHILQLLRSSVEILRVRSRETDEDLLRFLQLDELLEDGEEGDVGLRDDFGEVVPLAERELDSFVAELVEVLLLVLSRLERLGLDESHVRFKDSSTRSRDGAHSFDRFVEHIAFGGPVGESPRAFEEQLLVAFILCETAADKESAFEIRRAEKQRTRQERPTAHERVVSINAKERREVD